ncbi:hypothetical protein [uncultured Mucilaginibacter sp.]|nr:hypothetical protein [uncultured Mucilaginibacter sp.]
MKDIIGTAIIMVLCIVGLVLRNANEDTVTQHKPDAKKRDER